jgi:hypothetical protein
MLAYGKYTHYSWFLINTETLNCQMSEISKITTVQKIQNESGSGILLLDRDPKN